MSTHGEIGLYLGRARGVTELGRSGLEASLAAGILASYAAA